VQLFERNCATINDSDALREPRGLPAGPSEDLADPWKRLVICKELLHVFDSSGERVATPEAVKKLITLVLSPISEEVIFFRQRMIV
jgi:hypothetical protein